MEALEDKYMNKKKTFLMLCSNKRLKTILKKKKTQEARNHNHINMFRHKRNTENN